MHQVAELLLATTQMCILLAFSRKTMLLQIAVFEYVQSFFARDFWHCSQIIGSLFVEVLVHHQSFHIIMNH